MGRTALLILGSLALALYTIAIVLLVVFQGALIFPAPKVILFSTPANAGLAFQDLYLPVDGTTRIHAWWVPASTPTAKVLLYFHGNAQVLEDEAGHEAPLFHQTGANLLLVDYRGYGRSSPLAPSGATMAADARAAMRYLTEQRSAASKDIFLCGWSIGTGVAAQLATETPHAGGLILFSAITSVPDIANQQWIFRYPLRAAQWLRHTNDFATKTKIASIHMPLLLMTGSRDSLAQPWMARQLYARANEPKTLVLVNEAEHNDIFDMGGDQIVTQMKRLLVQP